MHTSRKPTQIQRLRRTLGFGSAFTSVLKRLLIRLAFFIRPATDQKMCACPSAFAGTTREDSIVKQSNRHCEPTGRANARRITGSAKQSIEPQRKMDCFVATLLAMTVSPFVPARRPCESRDPYAVSSRFGRGGRNLLSH